MIELEYDDTKLKQLYAELSSKDRRRVLSGAFRRVGLAVRKDVIALVRSGLSGAQDREGTLAKGVRLIVYKKDTLGFRVTVGTSGRKSRKNGKVTEAKGYHTNRYGNDKPVLMWADIGTASRTTRGGSWLKGGGSAKPKATGSMPRIGFIARATSQDQAKVTAEIGDELRTSVIKVAKKYGCK